ncbi:methyltransferase [Candidatus Woesearchaeota archaeon]|nr:methyltransferase [Candidatus Woesearchaeota archaeon]
MPEIYEPREDTFMIEKEVKRFAKGRVLDIGTGTGVLAIEASQKADYVVGCDVNNNALDYAKKKAANMELKNIKFVNSDLFSYFKENPDKFDLIIFNPPYLPEEKGEDEEVKLQVSGGKKGYEVLERFFSEVSEYLELDGKILVLFSTLTGVDKVHSILDNLAFSYQKLSEETYDFETLFVYLVEKNAFLKKLEFRGITNVKKLAKGHRGIVYTGIYDGKKVAIKKKKEESEAVGRMENEARWLKFLNRKGIGPNFIYSEDDYLVYYFVEGELIMDYLKKASKEDIRKVLVDVLKQCYTLDQIGVNKEEMHHPLKHILVQKNNVPALIDFERVHSSKKPKNVTQFLQFVSSKPVMDILGEKGFKNFQGWWVKSREKILGMAKKYKRGMKKNIK